MRVYISREAQVAQPFAVEMKHYGIDVLAFPQIEIHTQPFEIMEGVEWIFFSSSNAAISFFQSQVYNPDIKYAAIGNATAAAVPGPCGFVGQSIHTNDVALAFKECVQDKRVLFPIGDRSVRTVQSVFDPEQIEEVVVYQTTEVPQAIPSCEAYVFSSPSNVYAAMKQTALQNCFCFSFGKSTTKSLVACGVQQIVELQSLEPAQMAAQIARELNG